MEIEVWTVRKKEKKKSADARGQNVGKNLGRMSKDFKRVSHYKPPRMDQRAPLGHWI